MTEPTINPFEPGRPATFDVEPASLRFDGVIELLSPDIEVRLHAVISLEELRTILAEIEKPIASSVESSPARIELLPGLSEMDSKVLQLGGDQLVAKDRFASLISVSQLADAIGSYDEVNSSIRMLTELGYFKASDQDHARYLVFSAYGFDQYLTAFRASYGIEQRKICAEIVHQERTREVDIVVMTELPRPIVEHVINVLTSKQLIDFTLYNSDTQIHAVSEHLRRQVLG